MAKPRGLEDDSYRSKSEVLLQIPSKDCILAACIGNIAIPHPVLAAARDLTVWHTTEPTGDIAPSRADARAEFVGEIDRWVATEMPRPHAAAPMHSETLGMVVDRIGRFAAEAHSALARGVPECELHFAWKRLAEMTIAYADLAEAIATRARRLPDLTACHWPDTDTWRGGAGNV